MDLDDFYSKLSKYKGSGWMIPRFDFRHGATIDSPVLFLLESPGPQVRVTGLISLCNDDPSASNLKRQLQEAEVPLSNILLWNIVPWLSETGHGFIRPKSSDIQEARPFTLLLGEVFRSLSTIVFVGSSARKELVFYSGHSDYRLLSAHHPSAQAMAVKNRWDENVAVFRRLRART